MNEIEIVQKIGNEVCEDCGPNADCGITPSDCSRIENALNFLSTRFDQGVIFACAEVIRNGGSVEAAYDAAGFSDEEIETCAEFDVKVLRDSFAPNLPKGFE